MRASVRSYVSLYMFSVAFRFLLIYKENKIENKER